MKKILLSQNRIALIDDSDFEEVSKHNWFYDGRYARTSINWKKPRLHRFIMKPGDDQEIDHINGNPLDNRRENLRLTTHQENLRNQKLSNANTSGFKGVCWDKSRSKWIAYIKVDQKLKSLGRFDRIDNAASAYNKAAIQYFGEFARINHI